MGIYRRRFKYDAATDGLPADRQRVIKAQRWAALATGLLLGAAIAFTGGSTQIDFILHALAAEEEGRTADIEAHLAAFTVANLITCAAIILITAAFAVALIWSSRIDLRFRRRHRPDLGRPDNWRDPDPDAAASASIDKNPDDPASYSANDPVGKA